MPLSSAQLSQLLDQHWGTLCAWLGSAKGQSDDIVQEAFIRLSAQEPPPENCLAWLLTVTRRLAINGKISERRRRQREQTAGDFRNESIAGQTEVAMKLDIEHYLSQLDHEQRQILIARIWGQLSFDQIADVLELSRSGVYRTYQHAIQILKQAMSDL